MQSHASWMVGARQGCSIVTSSLHHSTDPQITQRARTPLRDASRPHELVLAAILHHGGPCAHRPWCPRGTGGASMQGRPGQDAAA
jgi:hypothetical protein